MKPKTLILMLVAVGCGLVAAFLVRQVMGKGAQTDAPKDQYLVALTDMNPGDKITNIEQQFKIQDFLPGTAPVKAFQVEDIKAKPDKMLGKVLVRPIGKGEAITERHLKDDNLTDKLLPGQRAITIPVRLDAAVTGFALPDNRVDLICNYQKDNNLTTRIFLQDIKVLAVNTETTRQPAAAEPTGSSAIAAPTVVTLAVKPLEAEKIAWALRQSGVITLMLRKPGDDAKVKTAGTGGLEADNKEGGGDEKKETVLRAKRDIKAGENIVSPGEYFEEVKDIPASFNDKGTYVPSLNDDIFKEKLLTQAEIKMGEYVTRRSLGKEPAKVEFKEPEIHTLRIFNGSREVEVKYARTGGGYSSPGSPGSSGADTPSVPPTVTPGPMGTPGK